MQTSHDNTERLRWLAASTCAVSFFSLLSQYVLLIGSTLHDIGPLLGTVRFFSYFTILTNILVVLVTASALVPAPAGSRFFVRPTVRGAVALYIGVTGLVYATVLHNLWQPTGLQWWADTGLHYATPLLYLTWWVFGARHGTLHVRDVAWWLLFPLGYLLWCFLRGAWVHEYPYPFIDVIALGWSLVLRNAVGVLLVFLVLSALLLVIDRSLRPRTT